MPGVEGTALLAEEADDFPFDVEVLAFAFDDFLVEVVFLEAEVDFGEEVVVFFRCAL